MDEDVIKHQAQQEIHLCWMYQNAIKDHLLLKPLRVNIQTPSFAQMYATTAIHLANFTKKNVTWSLVNQNKKASKHGV